MTADDLIALWRRLGPDDRRLVFDLAGRLAGPVPEEEPEVGLITGTVAYRERIAMPPGAVVIASLQDVSRADAPSLPLAEHRIEPAGNVPVPFELRFDVGSLDRRGRYAVRATIEVDGKPRWTTDTVAPIDPSDLPTHVHLLLRAVPPGPVR